MRQVYTVQIIAFTKCVMCVCCVALSIINWLHTNIDRTFYILNVYSDTRSTDVSQMSLSYKR